MSTPTVSIFADFNVQDWTDPDKVLAYLRGTDPAVLAPLALWVLTLLFVRTTTKTKLTFGERFVGWWLLFNGILIHFFLDGIVGFLGRMPLLYEEYGRLDARYPTKDPSVMMISFAELVIYTPLCLWAHHAVHTGSPYRHPAIIIISAIQWTGTWVFTGAEIFTGFPHIPADINLEFKTHHIIHFWLFFVAANTLWTLLPMYLVYSSSKAIAAAFRAQAQQKTK